MVAMLRYTNRELDNIVFDGKLTGVEEALTSLLPCLAVALT